METPIYIVLSRFHYEGDQIEAVFFDRDKAFACRNSMQPSVLCEHVVEEWLDGETEGKPI